MGSALQMVQNGLSAIFNRTIINYMRYVKCEVKMQDSLYGILRYISIYLCIYNWFLKHIYMNNGNTTDYITHQRRQHLITSTTFNPDRVEMSDTASYFSSQTRSDCNQNSLKPSRRNVDQLRLTPIFSLECLSTNH